MSSETMSFTVPETLRLALSAIPETGYYDSTSEFLRDAVRQLLEERQDVRTAIACALYKQGKVSVGRAAEIAQLTVEEMHNLLAERAGTKVQHAFAKLERKL
ncbi:MAG: UPF0175 family protein [Candidatus Woesearchaeota archaeon]|nr:UPF0175 family protein [Candidatus Woesearchaeota archaeon]